MKMIALMAAVLGSALATKADPSTNVYYKYLCTVEPFETKMVKNNWEA